ncbi:hypothetical protein [Empedobacter sp.]|nr:hypothetical protein [Empedobacter sp.]
MHHEKGTTLLSRNESPVFNLKYSNNNIFADVAQLARAADL